jgi:transposase-like protein
MLREKDGNTAYKIWKTNGETKEEQSPKCRQECTKTFQRTAGFLREALTKDMVSAIF